jgi:hypothetical protein
VPPAPLAVPGERKAPPRVRKPSPHSDQCLTVQGLISSTKAPKSLKHDLLVDLVSDGLAIMRSERMRVGGRMKLVSRVKITKAGRQALAEPASKD